MIVEWLRRLEPLPPYEDLQRGFRQEVADPLWMLGRQWQLGEHTGEDAGSPVGVTMTVARTPIAPVAGLDPGRVPAEAIVEGATEDWWTIGRRIRIGRQVSGSMTAAVRKACAFTEALPAPYGSAFVGEVDGLLAWRNRQIPADHPALAGFRRRPDHWSSEQLRYNADFKAGQTKLQVRGHAGGAVDWYTADADKPIGRAAATATSEVVPMRLQYPGAPHPRVWQIEDHTVDIGGYPPDRSHLATALLIELVTDHAGDWFLAPVPAPFERPPRTHGVGTVVTLAKVEVRNTFDEVHQLLAPPGEDDPPAGNDQPPGPWSLFRTHGLDRSSLVLWPTAASPLTGPVLDDVVFGVDEDANLLWAVEERAAGVQLLPDAEARQALADGRSTGTREFGWMPMTTLPPHWHPYRGVPPGKPKVFEQGVVIDFREGHRKERPGPVTDLIRSTRTQGHLLDLHAVPYQGLRLERRYVLARCTDGSPALWRERKTVPLLDPPASHLRFDVLREAPPED